MASLLVLGTGLVIVAGGLYVLSRPRMQGARDVDLIESEEPGTAERAAAYVAGAILVLGGLGFVYLGL